MSASTFVIKVAPRGKDAPGLMKYLFGPGKANEHTDQHLVAGSASLKEAYAGALAPDEARELGRVIEQAWRAQAQESLALVGQEARGVSSATLTSGGAQGELLTTGQKEHVYHVIVSQPPGHAWSDEQYETIAHDVAQGMGFSSGPDDMDGARWIAMRHGQSANGNEHMHMVFNLVREDGERVRFPQADFNLAQNVRRAIEQRYDFVVPLEDRKRETTRSLPAYTMAEHQHARERAQTTGQEVPDRVTLQQLVRSGATTSATEYEFIHTVLDSHPQIDLEPARWATSEAGERSVTGYKVRLGEGGRWITASQLAPDLTLGELRPGWAQNETEQTRAAARALWSGEAEPGTVEEVTPTQAREHLDSAAHELEQFNAHLSTLTPDDREEWSRALSETAGIVSTLGATPGRTGETFSIVSTELARAHLNQDGRPRVHAPAVESGPSRGQLAARHVQLAVRASDPSKDRAWLAVTQQMSRTIDALRDAAQARGELAAARAMHENSATPLRELNASVAPATTQASTREQVNYADLDSRAKQRFISQAIRDGRTNPLDAGSQDAAPRRGDGPDADRGHGRSL